MKIARRELHITTSRRGVPGVKRAFLTRKPSVIPKNVLIDTGSVCLFNLLRSAGKLSGPVSWSF